VPEVQPLPPHTLAPNQPSFWSRGLLNTCTLGNRCMLLLAHLLHSMHREPVERHTGTAALRSRSLGAPLQTHDSGRKHAFLDTNATLI
jgi:hypothetical protein